MAIGWEQLAGYVNADYESEVELTRHVAVAKALVDGWVGTSTVPTVILDEAYLLVAAELWDRAKTPDVQAGQFETPVTPMRISRDPLNPAYRILRQWVRPF